MGAEERADAPGLVTAYLYAADDVDREIELELEAARRDVRAGRGTKLEDLPD